MTDVDRLLAQYVEEHRAGGKADPLEYLSQVEGVDRLELEAMLDAYLSHTPPREMDPAAYAGSFSEHVVESLTPALTGVSGLWPAVLPQLRDRARIRRADLVAQLATALGVGDRVDKVGDYYNQMEQGRLPAERVSSRVLEALAGIVGTSAERLQALGRAVSGPAPAGGEAAAFARMAPASAAPAAPRNLDALQARRAPEWDEVDELFRGEQPK